MPRSNEATNQGIPLPPDHEGWRHGGDGIASRIVAARMQGYDPGTLGYVDVQVDTNGIVQTAGGGGGGGSVTQGTVPWVTNDPGLPDSLGQKTMAGSTGVVLASDQSAVPVSGTFWQATQPVSATSLPLPSGAATDASLTNGNLRVGGSVAVTGAFFQATQPVSATSLPLPIGAATDASLASIFGTPTSDSPGSFTVLDQLSRIRKVAEQNQKTMQALLAAAQPPLARKTPSTLLHRS